MKLEIERQDFLRAWQNAEKLASAKSASESAKGVLITASDDNTVILEATDLNTSIRCRAKGANVLDPGKAVIPAGIFGGMLRKLDTEDFVLEVNSERGFLNAGRNKMRFSVISAEEFPNIPESSNAEHICDISAPLLAKIIAEGSSAASQPQDFPKYLGTCLVRTSEGVIMAVSTDGKRLSLSKSTCSASKEDDLLLPAQALKDFAKATASLDEDKSVSLRADDSTVWFGLEDYEYSIRRVDSAFPKFERILNTECRTTLHINSGDLNSTLERIDIIAKTTPAHIMAMALNPNGELRITARAPELGTARETLQTTIEGGELQVGFNVAFFMDGLKALGGEQTVIEFSGEEGQTRMKREGSDDFLYMLMPARLSTQDAITEEEMGDFTSTSDDPMPMPEPEPEPEQEQEAAPESQDNQEVSSTDAPL
ncbi:MAG: DNA polymerase III subunit beta [Synergistaceae bacterium]|nr:DNA polymerase III subunit beta [Synergistaceae bacterium]MBQ3345897.1 DNA polymerase III subunit beta [Synergistaceae bacterium]MBQ3759805.1 DNA polymerase III subunit beta [Synergistaceae bacterium]MBQ6115057.1 DNA polymerase III subunit beta [Synergistaceae bacterium]MBQ6664382.1 DNA polymerase III subunit beta [Synergistaceae bacterium]